MTPRHAEPHSPPSNFARRPRATEECRGCSEKGVRSAQHTQVGLCVPVGIQLENAEVGPTSGPTWRLSHLWVLMAVDQDEMCVVLGHVIIFGIVDGR